MRLRTISAAAERICASSRLSSGLRWTCEDQPMNDLLAVSRRRVLKAGGAVIVSFALFPAFKSYPQGASAAKPISLTEVDSFLSIDSGGLATIYSGKVDIGTGVRTAFTQIAAEELDLPMKSVTILQ